jgi:flagellar hook-basal body complex protein FliE
MNEIGMSELLGQLRALASQAQGQVRAPAAEAATASPSNFQSLLRNSIEGVNQSQLQAQGLAQAFEAGQPGVDLSGVMVAMQKANVSFQAMVQVRNKLVSAYQEIMSMPV